jgi:hypothetical protein
MCTWCVSDPDPLPLSQLCMMGAQGKLVVVVDDADRENEGDLIMAAEKASTETIAFFVRYSSGVICVAMEHDELERLKLPPMVVNNEVRRMASIHPSIGNAVADHLSVHRHILFTWLTLLSPGADSAGPQADGLHGDCGLQARHQHGHLRRRPRPDPAQARRPARRGQ